MTERIYVEGSVKVQLALVFLLVVGIGLFFHLEGAISQVLVEIQLLAGSEPVLAIRTAGRLLLWLVFFSGSVAVAIGVYLLLLSVRVVRGGCYPPANLAVAFRTELKLGAAAQRMAGICRLLALLLLLQPLLGLFLWYRITGAAW